MCVSAHGVPAHAACSRIPPIIDPPTGRNRSRRGLGGGWVVVGTYCSSFSSSDSESEESVSVSALKPLAVASRSSSTALGKYTIDNERP